ncbi:MAG: ABC transporter ATP-binding protein, partial [Dorea sp.]|nr:ABC transporter ATP-binding protein [Dorea sp.]
MFRFCGKYITKYKKQLALYLIVSIVSTIIAILIPVYWGKIIDLMTTSNDILTLLQLGIFVLLLGLFNIIICYWNNRCYIVIQTNSAMDISADIIHHLHKISLNKLQMYDIGYLNESINSDSNSITMFFLSLLIN